MRKLLLVVLALVALNPRVMLAQTSFGTVPQAIISCSTGLQVHWGRLLPMNVSGRAGLFGVFTKESAVDAFLSMTLDNIGPMGSGLPQSEMRGLTRNILSKPCG